VVEVIGVAENTCAETIDEFVDVDVEDEAIIIVAGVEV
jgi:hypothetical protein